jgi:hypothetical protein
VATGIPTHRFPRRVPSQRSADEHSSSQQSGSLWGLSLTTARLRLFTSIFVLSSVAASADPIRAVVPVQVTSRISLATGITESFNPPAFDLAFTFDGTPISAFDEGGVSSRTYGNPTFGDIPLSVPPLPRSAKTDVPTLVSESTVPSPDGLFMYQASALATQAQCCEGSALDIRQVWLNHQLFRFTTPPPLDPARLADVLRIPNLVTGLGASFQYSGEHRVHTSGNSVSTGFVYLGYVVPSFLIVPDPSFSPVPEPATFALVGTGLSGVVARRWARKKQRRTYLCRQRTS